MSEKVVDSFTPLARMIASKLREGRSVKSEIPEEAVKYELIFNSDPESPVYATLSVNFLGAKVSDFIIRHPPKGKKIRPIVPVCFRNGDVRAGSLHTALRTALGDLRGYRLMSVDDLVRAELSSSSPLGENFSAEGGF